MANNVITALIIFVDIRGFSAWSEKVENFNFLDDFSDRWYGILRKYFEKYENDEKNGIKFLGDGAMIVYRIKENTNTKTPRAILADTLSRVKKSTDDFHRMCENFSETKGSKIPLRLGRGIVRGDIKQRDNEYIGAEINKCSRYCDIARPFGIVIDAVDFPGNILPKNSGLVKQTRKFSGIDEAEVWVTKEIYSQFLKREDLRQTPEVHVSGICLKKEGDKYFVLLGKRLPARKLYPGLYEGCGGQLAANEIFTDGVKRHYLLEYGITVSVEKDIHTFYDINEAGSPLIPGISFLCEYVSGTPQSENHAPNPDWADENQFNKMEGYLVYSRSQRANRIFFTKYKERLQSRCS